MKRKLREIDDPWEIQIAYHVRQGTDPEKARLATIIYWAHNGDLRPLQRAIADAQKIDGGEMVAIDEAILGCIQRLITEGRLIVKRGRGAPRSPDKFVRDLLAVIDYEQQRAAGKSSNAARMDVCRKYGISGASFREALPRMRKALALQS
jgi:hypothetical protein